MVLLDPNRVPTIRFGGTFVSLDTDIEGEEGEQRGLRAEDEAAGQDKSELGVGVGLGGFGG